MCVDLEFHHLPLAQQLILPFFIYSFMKGQESLALQLHSFHLYINQIPCSLQFLCVIPLQILYCTIVWLMRFVPNQRVPSSGYNTLNSIALNDSSRSTFFNIDKLPLLYESTYYWGVRNGELPILICVLYFLSFRNCFSACCIYQVQFQCQSQV